MKSTIQVPYDYWARGRQYDVPLILECRSVSPQQPLRCERDEAKSLLEPLSGKWRRDAQLVIKHPQAVLSVCQILHAGIMLYGTGYWGVTEANYLVVAGHFVSALLGAWIWEGDYHSIFGWQLPGKLSIRRGDINLLLVVGGGIQQAFGCIYRTLESPVGLLMQVATKKFAVPCVSMRLVFKHPDDDSRISRSCI